MLSMTHIAVGLASTIAVLSPQTPTELCPVVIGGAVGSIICDIDCKYGKSKDAELGRAVAGVISAVALYIDIQNQGKIFFLCYGNQYSFDVSRISNDSCDRVFCKRI